MLHPYALDVPRAAVCKPEIASLNMGSMIFGLFLWPSHSSASKPSLVFWEGSGRFKYAASHPSA